MADLRSDGALLELAKAGDDNAFGLLIGRYARTAFVVARGVVSDPDLAEDVCQDALFRVWKRLDACLEPERFGSWLLRAVRRQALNAIRGRRTVPVSEAAEASAYGPAPDRQVESAELRARLDWALGRLSMEQREAVLLFDQEGLPHAAIAELLGISEAMSRQHLMLGRRRLRELLGGERP
jgi:RNA polymerase sigma-70 factor (ECF subfamily)